MPHITSGIIGAGDVNLIQKAADVVAAGNQPLFPPGHKGFGSDGKTYVYGKAAATIASGASGCAITLPAGTVAASGGTLVAPTIAGGMATGDYGWFGQADPA